MLDLFKRYRTKVDPKSIEFRVAVYELLPGSVPDVTEVLQKKFDIGQGEVKEAYDFLFEEMQRHIDTISNFADRVNQKIGEIEVIMNGILPKHTDLTEDEINTGLSRVISEEATEEEKDVFLAEEISLNNAKRLLSKKEEYALLQQPYTTRAVDVVDDSGKVRGNEKVPTSIPRIDALRMFQVDGDAIQITSELRDYVLSL